MDQNVHSLNIHTTVSRDYDRRKIAQRHEVKCEQLYDQLERQLKTKSKWNSRVDSNHLRSNDSKQRRVTSITLDEFIQQERNRQDQIIQAKKKANQRIRQQ
jgi:nucleoside phosphorylase